MPSREGTVHSPLASRGTGLSTACSRVIRLFVSLLQSLGLSLGLRRPSTLFPWRRAPTLGRVRRAWVIPPISVSENHKRLPYPLVQVRGREWSGQSQGRLSSWVPERVL